MQTDDYGETGVGGAGWRWLVHLVVRRAVAERSLLAPAFVMCLIATTLVAAGPIFTNAVATAGVRSALTRAPTTAVNLRAVTPADAPPSMTFDATAVDAISRATVPAGARIERQLRSGSFTLDGRPELVQFAWFEDGDRVPIVDGRAPSKTGEIAVPQPVAAALGWRPEDTVELTEAAGDEMPVRLTISGIYRVADPDAIRWWGAPPVAGAQWERGGFTIYGPVLTDRTTLIDVIGVREAWWTGELAIDRVDATTIGQVRRNANAFASRTDDELQVTTDLPTLLDATAQRLLGSRAATLTVVLQVLVLAGYALVLATGLIASERHGETELLRSRGASPMQMLAAAVSEALLIAAPATLLGPVLARGVVGVLATTQALSAAELHLEPIVTGRAVMLAIGAGIAAIVTLSAPALVTALRTTALRGPGRRQSQRGAAQRAGVDIAMLGIAVIAYWQFRQAGGLVTTTVRGRLGIDPLLVAAPALCLLTGAVLALRAVPLLARLAERAAVTGRWLIPALGAWQVARRPRTYARAALLPVLAVALGLFAVSFAQTRAAAQAALAADRVPADLRVTPGRAGGVEVANLAGAYTDLDGVTAAVPALTDTTTVSRDAGRAGVLAVDTAGVDALTVDARLAAGMRSLTDDRPQIAVLGLGDATRLQVHATAAPTPDETEHGSVQFDVLIRDGFGIVHRFDGGEIASGVRVTTSDIDLAGVAPPVALAGLELRVPVDVLEPRRFEITFDVRTIDGASVIEGSSWTVHRSARAASVTTTPDPLTVADDGIAMQVQVGPSAGVTTRASVHVLPGATMAPDAVGLIMTDDLARTFGVDVGDAVALDVGAVTLDGRVTLLVPTLPIMPDHATAGGVLVDLSTLATSRFANDQGLLTPSTWLLDVDGPTGALARRLRSEPFDSAEVLDRAALVTRQRTDPVALGVLGALSLSFAAAAALAALGLVVTAVASIRERTSELALMRAIGLSGRQLAVSLSLEQAVLLTGALAGGVALGAAMSWLVLPYTALDATGSRPAIAVPVQVAWSDVGGLVAVVLGTIGASVLLMVRPIRRLRLGAALRAGEDR